jgi:acyl carrier protein phosphodiesterase
LSSKAALNFLGHFILAHPDEELMVGNYLGDLVHIRDIPSLPEPWIAGIDFHRFIDRFTDAHPAVDQLNRIFRPAVGKYAPVATDIVMDYFIFLNWEKIHPQDYHDFAESVYELLQRNIPFFPEPAAMLTLRMSQAKWLDQYKSLAGLEDVMRRMNRKAKFSVDFVRAVSVVEDQKDQLEVLFLEFYQAIRAQSQEWISLRNEAKT